VTRQRGLGTHRYQVRALSSIARFLPVFVGVLLASVFSLSVLRDDAQVARIAFEVGNELLGLYGASVSSRCHFSSWLRRGCVAEGRAP